MTLFKRLSATIHAQVDQMVGRIENHDAVVEAAIKEARAAIAAGKVRLARVRRDGETMKRRVDELRASEQKWAERARSLAEQDEDRALACLARRRLCQGEIDRLEAALESHVVVQLQLEQQVQKAERQLNERNQQRNLMRTREAASQALQAVAESAAEPAIDIDNVFERWEVRITESEMAVGTADPGDVLERRFLEQEDRESLKAELEALKGKGE